MSSFPFPHDLHVYTLADDHFETAYYARDRKKYKRTRKIGTQTWAETTEQEIDSATFWMVTACIEAGRRSRARMV